MGNYLHSRNVDSLFYFHNDVLIPFSPVDFLKFIEILTNFIFSNEVVN